MTYEETMDYLVSLTKFGISLGMERISRLVELMQHPERRFKSIHVTGSNGKGSTTAMLAAIMTASGIKTGMYTSPHLDDYPERMIVNGKQIAREEFAQAINYTRKFVEQMLTEGYEHPTEFEILTAAAFYYFAAVGVEYVVVEVGLGGLLDSTNVIVPEVSVVTNVTLEHTDRCGGTVAEIATHKAGIIKEGIPVVTGAGGAALDVITRTAVEKQAKVYTYGREFSNSYHGMMDGRQKISFQSSTLGNIDAQVNLLGFHQVDNSAMAIATALVLAQKDKRITFDAIQKGLRTVTWPGRFELVAGKPIIVIDGAHNPDGARVLRKNLDEVFPGKNITFALGILRDKDVTGIIRELIKPNDTVVTVQPLSYRAATPEEIAQVIEAKHVEAAASIDAGIERAKELAGPEGIVCVAGSLYLIGEARQVIYK
ncbi:MAG TPA: folylpolyglutamate synthase/dihydrofolate synthase family protein [Methylomusa anaerophila]|uniref:tetrahydrofolate synthase n=1 Tax=Methylomusa anaerophila TaxID=1930071 RepID=A0A348AFC4_9FIRM|nr:folylpolyglutamate synthase/dihydrofolate synthase family protein [Methylomusa anaerophila]BBB89772.1 folylpolyglutamate synthase [Methylomusa anaerophila]HML89181.1 folylpolyglutamate synthase/dihydrofolate synthase family protein [Methylomusa anaerophila]